MKKTQISFENQIFLFIQNLFFKNNIKSKWRYINNGKMKTKWEGQFFSKKNLRTQLDVVSDSESNGFWLSGAIWWWLMAIWKFEICAIPTAYAKFFWGTFLSQ